MPLPPVIRSPGLSYFDLRRELLKSEYQEFTTLIIGNFDDIQNFTNSNFDSIVPVFSAKDQSVKMVLDSKEVYYLDSLALSRSLDFRPDGVCIKGITLVVLSPSNNWRNYQ